MLKHQSIARCHTERKFGMDAATFGKISDLILPHVVNPWKRKHSPLGFLHASWCLTTSMRTTGQLILPMVTQQLQVVLARVGDNVANHHPMRTDESRLTSPQSPHHRTSRAPCRTVSNYCSGTWTKAPRNWKR